LGIFHRQRLRTTTIGNLPIAKRQSSQLKPTGLLNTRGDSYFILWRASTDSYSQWNQYNFVLKIWTQIILFNVFYSLSEDLNQTLLKRTTVTFILIVWYSFITNSPISYFWIYSQMLIQHIFFDSLFFTFLNMIIWNIWKQQF